VIKVRRNTNPAGIPIPIPILISIIITIKYHAARQIVLSLHPTPYPLHPVLNTLLKRHFRIDIQSHVASILN